MTVELKTMDINGREILRTGKWNGRVYSEEDLQHMVDSFIALRGVYDPPMKLGHNREQALLAKDGLPAAGWISNLYKDGTRLLADIRGVPGKLAAVIKAGGYKKVSSEIMFNAEIDGKRYPAVLRAVSWLGADPPAVAGMSDIFEMYSDKTGFDAQSYETVELTMTTKEREALKALKAKEEADEEAAAKAAAEKEDEDEDDDEEDKEEETEENKSKMAPRYTRRSSKMSSAESTLSEIKSILGLKPTDDVKQAVLSLKATHVELSDHQALVAKVEELTRERDQRSAEAIVDEALAEGKLAPKMRDWALAYCLSDQEGFETYVESAPRIVDYKIYGHSEDLSLPEGVDNPEAVRIARVLGNDPKLLSDTRPLAEKLAAQRVG